MPKTKYPFILFLRLCAKLIIHPRGYKTNGPQKTKQLRIMSNIPIHILVKQMSFIQPICERPGKCNHSLIRNNFLNPWNLFSFPVFLLTIFDSLLLLRCPRSLELISRGSNSDTSLPFLERAQKKFVTELRLRSRGEGNDSVS